MPSRATMIVSSNSLLRNARSVSSTSSGLSSTRRISLIGFLQGVLPQGEIEAGSLVRFPFRPHVPAVTMNDPLHRGEPDAGAREFGRGVQPLERSKQFIRVLRIEAGAVVADVERGRPVFVAAEADVDVRARPPT